MVSRMRDEGGGSQFKKSEGVERKRRLGKKYMGGVTLKAGRSPNGEKINV